MPTVFALLYVATAIMGMFVSFSRWNLHSISFSLSALTFQKTATVSGVIGCVLYTVYFAVFHYLYLAMICRYDPSDSVEISILMCNAFVLLLLSP